MGLFLVQAHAAIIPCPPLASDKFEREVIEMAARLRMNLVYLAMVRMYSPKPKAWQYGMKLWLPPTLPALCRVPTGLLTHCLVA